MAGPRTAERPGAAERVTEDLPQPITEDDLAFVAGIWFLIPVGLAVWALIIGAIVVLR